MRIDCKRADLVGGTFHVLTVRVRGDSYPVVRVGRYDGSDAAHRWPHPTRSIDVIWPNLGDVVARLLRRRVIL